MTHTKGPWEFKKLVYTTNDLYVVMHKTDVYTRRLDNLKGEFKKSDAQLIACAPELLDAIEQVISKETELSFDALTLLKRVYHKARCEK